MIVERLYQIQKAANEILEITNQDLADKYGEKYHDCDGGCDACFITGICSHLVDLASLDIDVMGGIDARRNEDEDKPGCFGAIGLPGKLNDPACPCGWSSRCKQSQVDS